MENIDYTVDADIMDITIDAFDNFENNSEHSTPKPLNKKLKIVKDWGDEEIYKLVALVEAERCLWDASDEAYHNKTSRDCAWRGIKDHFKEKFTVADLNAKWTNLRIQYRGYAGRAKTKSGQGVVDTPKWRFYNAMAFVGRAEHKQTQQTISNIVFNVDEENSSSKSSESDTKSACKRKQPTTAATQIAETMREAVNAMKQQKERASDPNVAFANYIVSELQTLKLESVAAVRKRVTIFFLECLEEERMKEHPFP